MKRILKIPVIIIIIIQMCLITTNVYAIKENNETPLNPVVAEKSETVIVLKLIDGYEYSINAGRTWQNSNVFDFLEPDTEYTFIQRIKENNTYEYSSNSEPISVTTNKLNNLPENEIPSGYIAINNFSDLNKIKDNLSANYILMHDIICDNNCPLFEPIGNDNEPFTGIFNGNNHFIVGIKQTNSTNLGLFGYNNGTIMNLNVIDSYFDITQNGDVIKTFGNIVGINDGEIVGCSSKNEITINKGTILGGKKSLKDNRSWYGDEAIVGGIVGLNNGKIYYCHYDGSLNITTQQQYSNIGGIAGYNNDMIKKCYNTANVSSHTAYTSSVGGICGNNGYGQTITYCYNTGEISNYNSYEDGFNNLPYGSVGSLVGNNEHGTLSYSYTLGNVKYKGAYNGILCGFNLGSVQNCYSMFGNDFETNSVSGSYNSCYFLNNFVNTSISEGIEKAKKIESYDIHFDWNPNQINEISIDNNINYPFPYIKKIGMINIKSNYSDYDGGNGLLNNPFRIKTKEQLKNINKNPYSYFILENDIIFNDNEFFTPIEYFYGVLDGNGHQILNLNINEVNEDNNNVGFIRTNYGKILNLNIINPTIRSNVDGNTGVYAGINNNGTFYNCHTESGNIIVSSSNVGGVTGCNGGRIINCSNSNYMEINTLDTAYSSSIGGIAGCENGFIENSFNSGNITINSKAINYNEVGGIAGSSGSINNCYNSGNITFESNVNTSSDSFSGICNYNAYEIKNCYNVGKIDYISSSGNIRASGISLSYGNEISNCYYLKDSINIINNNLGSNGKELDEASMKIKSNYQKYDFNNIWEMGTDTYLYPILKGINVTEYSIKSTLYGKINGNNINCKNTKISLLNKENNTIVLENGFVDNDGYYEISNLNNGSYEISIIKDNKIVNTENIEINNNLNLKNFQIYLLGDVNGDDKINITDVALINSHVKKVNILTGDELLRADVNGDSKVNITDVGLVNSHVKKVKMLEN